MPSPPENGNAFDTWQAEFDLILLRKVHSLEEKWQSVERMRSWAKVTLAGSVILAALITAAGQILTHFKGE